MASLIVFNVDVTGNIILENGSPSVTSLDRSQLPPEFCNVADGTFGLRPKLGFPGHVDLVPLNDSLTILSSVASVIASVAPTDDGPDPVNSVSKLFFTPTSGSLVDEDPTSSFLNVHNVHVQPDDRTTSFRVPWRSKPTDGCIDMADEPAPDHQSSSILIWNGKKSVKQKKIDDVATLEFIGYMKVYWSKFNDSLTAKKNVWKAIAGKMLFKYHLGTDPTEKCRLKWRNLWDAYKKYVQRCERTGSGLDVVDDVPPFYDQLIEIVGSNQAVHPEYVSDTLCPTNQRKWSSEAFGHRRTDDCGIETEENEEVDKENGKQLKRPESSSRAKNSSRLSKHGEILALLMRNEDKRDLEKQAKREERVKREEEKEKKKDDRHHERLKVAQTLVDTMRMLVESKKRKRRRSSSSSD